MTEKNKIIKLYKEKNQELLKFNKAYFEKDNPVISDFEFDELKKKLFQLVKKYPFLKKIENLDGLIGSKPSSKFEKIKHSKSYKSEIIDKKRISTILKKIKKESLKKNIDPNITKRIWKNMIWAYVNFEKRNFKKK